ncbi:hypothetical protein QE450_001846 [Paenibacillus sp. SORGH_AS306]|uniref:hypothetical protein n=1 Tax=unclassified Paenibacillus TaxID=185978 RepID=UPI00278B0162|nr:MULTISPECIES: hypothetical protein [unclassified Paenibacillus]MDQ1234348.1 hypothetical protein [Paenibacillus sp. SORGH_AS_0306]MDR6111394.1 hypothetical protein [Paenibacillus sp. SORGH_AS_0338]
MDRLQGGPFLEISFLMFESESIQVILDKLCDLPIKIEMHMTTDLLQAFHKGYLYDEQDSNSRRIHQICVPLNVHTSRTRRSDLYIQRIANNSLCFSMCFYGSSTDVSEWNQIGIKYSELDEFTALLVQIFEKLEFVAGGVAIEQDATFMFDSNLEYPHQEYELTQLTIQSVLRNMNSFYSIVVNKDISKDYNSKQVELLNKGILIRDSLHSTERSNT